MNKNTTVDFNLSGTSRKNLLDDDNSSRKALIVLLHLSNYKHDVTAVLLVLKKVLLVTNHVREF